MFLLLVIMVSTIVDMLNICDFALVHNSCCLSVELPNKNPNYPII